MARALVFAAASAAHIELAGRVKRGAGDTLDIPEGTINIGGNGYGYMIAAVNDWDPLASASDDGTVGSLDIGDDIYIYAVRPSGTVSDPAGGEVESPYAELVSSRNATWPAGYDADTSRKIGGFHVGRLRPFSERYNAGYVPTSGILDISCWDLHHRPRAEPEGMAEFMPGQWGALYQLSVISGTWPNEVYGSRYDATPARDTGGYTREDLYIGMCNAGMRKPSWDEWKMMAYGAPQGSDANNDTAWTDTSNTGPTTTGAVEKSVSCRGFVDCVGNLWEILEGNHDIGDYNGSSTPYEWDSSVVDVGMDGAYARGQVDHVRWRQCIAGGHFDDGERCGAATLHALSAPWHSSGRVGLRGVSESIRS